MIAATITIISVIIVNSTICQSFPNSYPDIINVYITTKIRGIKTECKNGVSNRIKFFSVSKIFPTRLYYFYAICASLTEKILFIIQLYYTDAI